ncbi:MAG: hypothetical protein PHF97_10010 [Bacteroidales bacterium]|nr:hypothetical protein [Bacteroidales bacterium]
MSSHSIKISLICISTFLLAFFLSYRLFEGDGKSWKHIVTSDGRGYFAYLPALLLDHDPTFGKVVEREKKLLGFSHYQPSYLVRFKDHVVNKYFCGEAILLLPFFLLALLFSWLFGTPVDGYSFFFQFFTGLGALFYLVTGLLFLARVLRGFQVKPILIAFLLPALLLGSNLFYYSLWQPTMSHLYSFFAINGFLWFTFRSIKNWNKSNASLAGLFLGLVFLIRPTNLVVLFLVPFLAGNFNAFKSFIQTLWKQKTNALLSLFIFLGIVSIQSGLWHLQTGRFFIWSYQHEGFIFSRPEVIEVLFGFRKGLFVYSPFILLTWIGLFFLLFKNRFRFFSMFLFIVASTYIITCWWNWYYGDSFGLRAFIDYYGIYLLLFALMVDRISTKPMLYILGVILLPLIFLNIFQTWQYTHRIIQPNSMNKDKYNYVFLRSDSAVYNCLGGNQEMADFGVDLLHPKVVFFNDFEKSVENWSPISIQQTPRAYSPEKVGYLDSVHPFSPGLAISVNKLGKLPSKFFVRGEFMVWDSMPGASNSALIVLSIDSINPHENYWQGFRLNDIPRNDVKKWRKCLFSLTLPEIVNPKGILKIYIWNTGKKPFLIDNVKLQLYPV